MHLKRSVLTAFLLALLAAGPRRARAQDEPDPTSPGEQSMGLMTIFGLSGVRSMVDARIPSQPMFRAFFRYVMEMSSERSATMEHSVLSCGGGVTIGIPLWGRVEGGFFAPFYLGKETTNRTFGKGSSSQWTPWVTNGDVGGKVGGQLDWISPGLEFLSFSPYVFSHLSDGRGVRRFDGYKMIEAGTAEGISFFDEQLALNVNTAFVDLNSGKLAFRYRVGTMFVPPIFASRDFVPRLSFYVDGLEYSGKPGSDLRVAFAMQAIVARTLLMDLNGEYRVYAGNLPEGLSDGGTGGFVASLGFRFTF